MPRFAISILVVTGFTLVGGYLGYSQYQHNQPTQLETFQLVAPPRHSLHVFIDPDTGRFARPTRQQIEQAQYGMAQAAQQLQRATVVRQIQHADGTVVLELEQHYRPESDPQNRHKANR